SVTGDSCRYAGSGLRRRMAVLAQKAHVRRGGGAYRFFSTHPGYELKSQGKAPVHCSPLLLFAGLTANRYPWDKADGGTIAVANRLARVYKFFSQHLPVQRLRNVSLENI
ncbi:MAG TPA: hypothetical protein VLH60_04650, partial [Sedimentisphaerales bacterium]|nr:hypothetical protein [Sedimentisphaerales bacterium]